MTPRSPIPQAAPPAPVGAKRRDSLPWGGSFSGGKSLVAGTRPKLGKPLAWARKAHLNNKLVAIRAPRAQPIGRDEHSNVDPATKAALRTREVAIQSGLLWGMDLSPVPTSPAPSRLVRSTWIEIRLGSCLRPYLSRIADFAPPRQGCQEPPIGRLKPALRRSSGAALKRSS
jgi:hypothetical protein